MTKLIIRQLPLLLASILACIPLCAAHAQALQESLDTAAEGIAVPGVVLLFDYPDKGREVATWGYADIEDDVAMQPDDLIRAGSVTKTYIAVLALKLAQDAYFDLDEPVHPYVMTDVGLLHTSSDPQAITFRQLLAHQSGIPDPSQQVRDVLPWFYKLLRLKNFAMDDIPNIDWEEPFAPGEGCRYSNMGYIVLGDAIEGAMGQSLSELLDEHIFIPLELQDTHFAARLGDAPPVDGYIVVDGELRKATLADSAIVAGAAGGVLTNAADLATFARALFSGELLTPAQWAEMSDFHAIEGGAGSSEYGLGLMRFTLGGRAAMGHSGSMVGYRSELVYFTDTGDIVIMLANCGRAPLRRIIDIVLDEMGDKEPY